MRKSVLAVLAVFVLGALVTAHGQTTYTVTADSCNGKVNMYCTLPTVDENGNVGTATIDNRNDYGNLYPQGWGTDRVHGTYSGFVSNPNGTRTDFFGTGSFVSDDGMVVGTFNYKAHYVGSCSGRGCGGTLGWHYLILTGSTIEVQ